MEVKMGTYAKTKFDYRLLSSLYILIVLFVVESTTGCALNTAKIEPDGDIAGKFKNSEVVPGYRYFHYSIGGYKTYAILGLDSGYTLDSRLWDEFDPGTDDFKKYINQLVTSRRSRTSGYGHHGALDSSGGFRLLDLEGKDMGVLYTNLGGTTVLLREGNRVIVSLEVPGKRGGGK
jgi:hypothetical protein